MFPVTVWQCLFSKFQMNQGFLLINLRVQNLLSNFYLNVFLTQIHSSRNNALILPLLKLFFPQEIRN